MEEEQKSHAWYRRPDKTWAPATVFVLFVVVTVSGVCISWLDVSTFSFPGASIFKTTIDDNEVPEEELDNMEIREEAVPSFESSPNFDALLNCTNVPQTCPPDYPPHRQNQSSYAAAQANICPEYFRWIHEDLRPWKEAGITRELLESSKKYSHFRIVVHQGKVYLDKFKPAYQTREEFTFWGFVQLLKLYPGQLPDLELMFQCEDLPMIMKRDFHGSKATEIPPLFHYCGHDTAYDITFPDWSFWGWPEVDVRPWKSILAAIRVKAAQLKWKDREPYAYWRGNPGVSASRGDLMKCNKSEKTDWNARLYSQDWGKERTEGFKHSNLEDQCTHRYKIYIEGRAWSVSEKYILACDSMALLVMPAYFDFFTRGMMPMEHYWPIRPNNKCKDIKFAVEWGNKHPNQAQRIGRNGSRFMARSLKMKYVYDYMFHLLAEYAKLLKFEVKVPPGAVELCPEVFGCQYDGLIKKYMVESMEASPSDSPPCSLQRPYEPHELKAFLERKKKATKQVEAWEAEYWKNSGKKYWFW